MTLQKYASKIEFNEVNNSLDIEIKYEKTYSEKEEEQMRDYFYWKANQRGNKVARNDIQVHPRSGDIVEEITAFQSQIGKEIYAGLIRVQEVAPYVFPLLIKDLDKYWRDNADKIEFVKHTISKLEKIAK